VSAVATRSQQALISRRATIQPEILMMTLPQITRRELLLAGVAGSVGLAALPEVVAEQSARTLPMSLIDAHSHIWSRDVGAFPLAEGQTIADLDPPSFTTDELLNVAGQNGVGRVVLIQHHIYHGWDNSYLIHAASEHPQRFRVVGMLDDTQPHPDLKMKALLEQRVSGFRITPWIRGSEKWLDGPGMSAMWKRAAETGQAMCCLIDAKDLENVAAMCRKHPQTKVVIDHFARIGVDGEIRESDVNSLCGLAKLKNTFVKISAYYALGKKQAPYHDLIPMIRRVYDAFGPERLMWASDAPYQVVGGHSYQASIDLVRTGLDFASEADREWLLRKTAEHVYFFDAT
jgi:predicted TIM-barrel fold metal-dependent hydrolase